MLEFTANKKQKEALISLDFWYRELTWCEEKFENDPIECKQSRDTLELCCFPECDRLNIPYWVQNTVLAYGENWRRWYNESLTHYLEKRNIYI